ncbi:serine/threonine-protein kinase haspin homolog isoform X1 [Phalaenopsis equestris]|uniref:serine/threonine-protein kinase haspin homolog isoform X1 n=1 Tax=Phalaenopsis equestris TaxID=78828 RepID=UPI0009E34367|nr:serine/threonine-protein kinase haspin homolog isoform X1 [Phalaenopsis equestris]
MEIASPDAERFSEDQIALVDEGRKLPRETNDKRNESNPWRRLNGGPLKRTSWNRSLSIRGRESIIFVGGLDLRTKPKQRGERNKIKQKKASEQLYDFSKEKAYFEEVDAFELLEESPSPNKFTWKMGADYNCMEQDLTAIVGRWRRSKLFSGQCTAWPLSKIMETIPAPSSYTTTDGSVKHGVVRSLSQIRENSTFEVSECKSYSATKKSTKEFLSEVASNFSIVPRGISLGSANKKLIEDLRADSVLSSLSALSIKQEGIINDECEGAMAFSKNKTCKMVKAGGMNDSGALPGESCGGESLTAFEQLLMVCKQSCPIKLSEVFLDYCDASNIIKLGEGTYGEAFRTGETVCKIVPIDGDLVVNGEVQKKSEEVLEEVLLSLTLNSLREQHEYGEKLNSCANFIETKDFRVCQGLYDTHLIRAWEEWDAKNNSENDHPCAFPDNQCYIVFVLADGGKDLENSVLKKFNEARSLLVQVTASLAVAEVACEFEHRDLHWGNILLRRNGATIVNFTLEGKKMSVNNFGLAVSIIDFTLSRINTGEAVLFLNLSADPELFKGPKLNIQFETYRRMKVVTGGCWEESFPKTNVLWLMYLVDILDKKKIFDRTTKDVRDLRSFKRRLNNYESAKDSLSDPFLSELLLPSGMMNSYDLVTLVKAT